MLAKKVFGVRIIEGNDVATKVFTGLPSWDMFLHVFMFLSPFVTPSKVVKLDDEFFFCFSKATVKPFHYRFVDLVFPMELCLIYFRSGWMQCLFGCNFLSLGPPEKLCKTVCL